MTDRRAQIIRLLETRDDHLPTPSRREHSTSGFVNEERPRSCPDCLANGRVMKSCETCGGSGTVAGSRLNQVAVPDVLPDDGEPRDPYAVEKVVPYGLDPTRHDRVRERDAELDRLASQTREPWKSPADELADANAHPEGWEVARARMRRMYDYDALDRALELLRDRDALACSLLFAAYIYGWVEPSTMYWAAVDRGLAFLEERLPNPLRAPGDVPAAAQLAVGRVARAAGPTAIRERDKEIRLAIEADMPTAEVARMWGISVRQVNRIIARTEAA